MSDRPLRVLITGGGRGLGRAIASRLAHNQPGTCLGVLARTEAEVEETAASLRAADCPAMPLVADVLNPESLERAVKRFRNELGAIDAVVCAAGCLRAIGPLGLVDSDTWWTDFETAVRGAERTLRAVLPDLRSSGRASVVMLVGPGLNGELAHASAYGAAQAALARLAESLAVELRDDRIGVYAVAPGIAPTRLMLNLLDSAEGRRWLPRFNEAFAEGKEIAPEVAAEMVAWLLTRRPLELSGRVVHAAQVPEFLETRLPRIVSEDLGRLRLR